MMDLIQTWWAQPVTMTQGALVGWAVMGVCWAVAFTALLMARAGDAVVEQSKPVLTSLRPPMRRTAREQSPRNLW